MAPAFSVTNSKLSNKEKHKLRKPVVEKMRRDRINTCIEQLKTMLEKEFHKQDPNTKLEKADILEMTVVFLKQQLQCQISGPRQAHSDGYSHCWRETLHFLSASSKADTALRHLGHVAGGQQAARDFVPEQDQVSLKPGSGLQKPVWRPW
ncbi:transcription factor HES-5-like [Denticeps clupeoides]|uniref:Transcription factor HES-5 n=1 Tax=Denticeps clupeoides TaxID=299321 RepID=A0AAY4C2W5_9TELE|nr:transcription factor HES-5-like [Denticeps clupeoides]